MNNALKKAREAEQKTGCMAYIAESLPEQKSSTQKGPLSCTFIAVKNNICVKGMPAAAGSMILEGYVPPFSATAITKLEALGATVIGKTVQDEFGFGTFNVNTSKIPKNPHDPSRATGGSSGGCSAFTAFTGLPSIAESTGGSITAPAAFCGVVGVTPTYGKISRYGLIDYANSLDKIGAMASSVEEAFTLVEAMSGPDAKDQTSLTPEKERKTTGKAAIIKELWDKTETRTQKQARKAVDALEAQGTQIGEISLKHTENALYAYYIIALAEASTNLAKYCGLRYGLQPASREFETYTEFFTRTRGAFGEEAKRRILLGSFARTAGYRGKYYDKACRVRTLVIDELKAALSKYDVLLTPAMPSIAPRFDEIAKLSPLEHYAMDICTVPFNLAGLPHASVPVGKVGGMPVGLQIIGGHFQENTVKAYSLKAEEAIK